MTADPLRLRPRSRERGSGPAPSLALLSAACFLASASAGVSHAASAATATASPSSPPPAPASACSAVAGPERIEMAATRRARGGSGVLTLRLSSSPFGVALAEDGSYRHHVEVAVEDLPAGQGRTHVVWAATPELDRHEKLGTVGSSGRVEGEVAWNKFLVFVTAERSAEVEEWSQEILLSARSPSGRMHTMAGHGPFSGEPCLDPRP